MVVGYLVVEPDERFGNFAVQCSASASGFLFGQRVFQGWCLTLGSQWLLFAFALEVGEEVLVLEEVGFGSGIEGLFGYGCMRVGQRRNLI